MSVDETVGCTASKSGGEEQTWMEGVAEPTQPQKAPGDGTDAERACFRSKAEKEGGAGRARGGG